jgi:hypothetical protein
MGALLYVIIGLSAGYIAAIQLGARGNALWLCLGLGVAATILSGFLLNIVLDLVRVALILLLAAGMVIFLVRFFRVI